MGKLFFIFQNSLFSVEYSWVQVLSEKSNKSSILKMVGIIIEL